MTFLEYINKLDIQDSHVVTIGNFDGVHIGHKRLIDLTVELGKKYDIKSIAFTYANHPVNYINGNSTIEHLTEDSQREVLIQARGIDRVLSVPFDHELKAMSCRLFMKSILLDKLKAKCLVIGADARIGRGKEGDAESIYKIGKELGIDVHIVSLVTVKGVRISSTYIRELIRLGNFQEANPLLGREFSISGRVVHGEAIGRGLGFPTANISFPPTIIIPSNGVYKTRIAFEDILYYGATNIGTRPTFSGKEKTIETYIIDFNKDIYNQNITIYFESKLRDEMKFSSKEELRVQLVEDIEKIKNTF